jgi:eukaryotic-like serine/threonine-protein kinase
VNIAEKYRITAPASNAQIRKFSRVFLCEDKAANRPAVLKSLAKTAANAHLQERLRQEAGFSFTTVGLPETLDFEETETEIMLVKSFIPGRPLSDYMPQFRRREKHGVLLRIMKGILPLLEELRSRRIVHLDLKPGNIIVNGSAASLSVGIIDFGMAAVFPVADKRSTLFPLGYAAPELILNRLHLADHRTDIFSLGAVLWQALSGKMPLSHPNPSIATNLQITHPLPEDRNISGNQLEILRKMSAKHTFGKPPNHYSPQQLDIFLKEAMNLRYDNLANVIDDWKNAKPNRFRLNF